MTLLLLTERQTPSATIGSVMGMCEFRNKLAVLPDGKRLPEPHFVLTHTVIVADDDRAAAEALTRPVWRRRGLLFGPENLRLLRGLEYGNKDGTRCECALCVCTGVNKGCLKEAV